SCTWNSACKVETCSFCVQVYSILFSPVRGLDSGICHRGIRCPGRDLNPIRFDNRRPQISTGITSSTTRKGPYLRDLGVLEAALRFAHSVIFSSCLTPARAANSANISEM